MTFTAILVSIQSLLAKQIGLLHASGDSILLSLSKLLLHYGKSIIYLLFPILLITSCRERKVDFNTEVRPILNRSCISCHGGVKQSGGFGLVFRENALRETRNGKYAIVPGSPDRSELIRRITHQDPEMRMPLEKDPLTAEEIEVLTSWIDQGAQWDDHWAYLLPVQPDIPNVAVKGTKNEIDQFIFHSIELNGLTPSEEANPYDLVRRVYLDLTGLPPSWEQVQEYVNSNSDNAFEELVDELLASPDFGEHWASMWLDLARYADSKGYEADRGREIWKYRDWVIKAINNDMPFDEFTINQLAGDLLPDTNTDQLIATAFHRNTLNNSEGGTDNEEYRIASVIDRVNTTWEVWQSTTMGCVQCHSHPYDPIKHEEFYSSFAFFNNTSDWDGNDDHPLLKELSDEDQEQLESVRAYIEKLTTAQKANQWEKFLLTSEPKLRPEDYAEVTNTVHHNRGNQDYMEVFPMSSIKVSQVDLQNIQKIYVNYRQSNVEKGRLNIRLDDADGPIIGSLVLGKTKGFTHLPIEIATTKSTADLIFQFESSSTDFHGMIDGFLLGDRLPGSDAEADLIYTQIDKLLNASFKHSTPVMIEKLEDHQRVTKVFNRGSWLDQGQEVSTDIPELLNTGELDLQNRLDLAQWLVSKENPLTARVMVNRFWAKLFGTGIVATIEDFGTLGDYPTHPELLDWLAIQFSNDWNWSMKTLLKQMVLSATYQQSATVTPENQEKDPYNKWLARSPRVRLSAEQIRDQALAISGLLSDKMYGPSVMPYQPDGVWSVVYSDAKWVTSEGEDAYRRGLYTYLRRSSPYPSFITFDAASREFCLSRRINTNTPLQALVTLNDPVYMEAARHLAQRINEKSGNEKDKMEQMYQTVMVKPLSADKLDILFQLYEDTKAYYKNHRKEAFEMAKANDLELASYIVVANALMNADEFLVKN